MIRILRLLAIVALAGCNLYLDEGAGESTGHVTQSLSSCFNADGLHSTCVTGNGANQCNGRVGQDACYCPEAQPNELSYCGNTANCGRPEYADHCKGGCPGNPAFVHWCVAGQMPVTVPLP